MNDNIYRRLLIAIIPVMSYRAHVKPKRGMFISQFIGLGKVLRITRLKVFNFGAKILGVINGNCIVTMHICLRSSMFHDVDINIDDK